MSNLVQLKDYVASKNVDISRDPSFQKLCAKFGLSLHPFGAGIFLLTPKGDEIKAAPMRLAGELRERGWFTAVVNERLYVVTQSQAKSKLEAQRFRDELQGIEEKANNAIASSLEALAKAGKVMIFPIGSSWLVKPKGQRASIKLLSKTDKRLEDYSKVIRRFGLHMQTFSTIEGGKFKQYAFIGSSKKEMSDLVKQYSSGALEVATTLYAADEVGKREEIERLGYTLKESRDGWLLSIKETRENLIPADILKVRGEMEKLVSQAFPNKDTFFSIHVANQVSYHLGIANSIGSAVKIARLK